MPEDKNDRSSEEYSGVEEEINVAMRGKGKDMANVVSSGKSAQEKRRQNREKKEREERERKEKEREEMEKGRGGR